MTTHFPDLKSDQLVACTVGRLLAGCGVGTASLVVPRYLVEIAPAAIRGALGTFSQVCTGVSPVVSITAMSKISHLYFGCHGVTDTFDCGIGS